MNIDLTKIGSDADLTDEQRTPCYADWTAYRDFIDGRYSCDIYDFRAAYQLGWRASEKATKAKIAAELRLCYL